MAHILNALLYDPYTTPTLCLAYQEPLTMAAQDCSNSYWSSRAMLWRLCTHSDTIGS